MSKFQSVMAKSTTFMRWTIMHYQLRTGLSGTRAKKIQKKIKVFLIFIKNLISCIVFLQETIFFALHVRQVLFS